MNLESQVVNLELSKKLHELGVKKESLFYWTVGGVVYRSEMPFWLDSNYSAFTASELGEMLPVSIHGESASLSNKPIILQKTEDGFYIYGQHPNGSINPIFNDDNEVNCRAKMLIHLIENKLIELRFKWKL